VGPIGVIGAADDPDLADTVEIEGKKLGVVAGPTFMDAAGAGPLEVTDDITVRIEHADFGHSNKRQLPLPAGLPQQGFGPEHRGCFVVLDADNRPRGFCAMSLIIHDAPAPVVSSDRFDRQAGGFPFGIAILKPADAIAAGPERCDGFERKDAIGAAAVGDHLAAFRKFAQA
jgi:hypothetical protein